MKEEVRIDKWLWAMRLFKTRSLAADACKKGKIMMAGQPLKPARTIRIGDIIQIKKNPIIYSFRVLALTENRLGAKLVPDYMQNVTTPDQYQLLEMSKASGFIDRDRGTGRPTKKERRDLDDFLSDNFFDDTFETE